VNGFFWGCLKKRGSLKELAVLLLGGHHNDSQDGNESGEGNIVCLSQGIVCPLDVLEMAELFPALDIVILDVTTAIDDGYAGHVGQRQTIFMELSDLNPNVGGVFQGGIAQGWHVSSQGPCRWLETVRDRPHTDGAHTERR
jgi:hypothetical protein